MTKFILKGLLRDRSRSIFPVMTVTAGVFLTVFLYGWMNGAIDNVLSANAQFDTGHVKIVTQAYNKLIEQMPNDLAIIGVNDLLAKLKNMGKDMLWTPRIRFAGLLDIPDAYGETQAQGPVMGFGVNLLGAETPEINILNLKKAVIKGRLPEKKTEILISSEFAKKLKLDIGDTATFIGSTMHGDMATYNFVIAGTVRFGINAMDRGTIIADIQDVRYALDMDDCAGEILGYTKDMMYNDTKMIKLSDDFNRNFFKKTDEFSPVMLSLSQQNDFAEYLGFAKAAGSIIVGIFVLAMSIVLWNSGLMNGLRRYGEIGVRLALGESKGTLYGWMIFESIITGFFGSCIGTLFGLAICFYLQHTGIDFSKVLEKSDIMISNVIRARVTRLSYIIGFFPGVIASMTGAVFAGFGIYKRETSQLFKELEV